MEQCNLVLQRSLSTASRSHIEELQSWLTGIDTFTPVERPHLTALDRHQTQGISAEGAVAIVHPVPESANNTATLDTDGFHCIPTTIVNKIALTIRLKELSDPLYAAGNQIWMDRLARMSLKPIVQLPPYVTVGYVNSPLDAAVARNRVRLLPPQLKFRKVYISPPVYGTEPPARRMRRQFLASLHK